MFARAGCGGRIFDASRPRAQGLPYQKEKEPAGHACHNCHSERSESTNAASAETACGLYLARRRETNEVQSNLCMLTIQILRRSAPQNDKLLNCSQTPRQTGISNWRQRGKVKEKMFGAVAACRAKYRRSAVRAEAPPCGGSQNSPRGLRHENNTAPTEAELANLQRTLFLNKANAACGVASPATTEVASLRAVRLRLAQHCEL